MRSVTVRMKKREQSEENDKKIWGAKNQEQRATDRFSICMAPGCKNPNYWCQSKYTNAWAQAGIQPHRS